MPFINLPKGTFSNDQLEDLEERLNLGIVEFEYMMVTDTDTHSAGQMRKAIGTRNLGLSIVPVDAIPAGLRTPPPYVLTYYDFVRKGWRCCYKHAITDYSEDIYIENV